MMRQTKWQLYHRNFLEMTEPVFEVEGVWYLRVGLGFLVGPIIVEHVAVILHRLAELQKSVLKSHPSAHRLSEFFHENSANGWALGYP